jgi:hypothetical protein
VSNQIDERSTAEFSKVTPVPLLLLLYLSAGLKYYLHDWPVLWIRITLSICSRIWDFVGTDWSGLFGTAPKGKFPTIHRTGDYYPSIVDLLICLSQLFLSWSTTARSFVFCHLTHIYSIRSNISTYNKSNLFCERSGSLIYSSTCTVHTVVINYFL